MSPPTAAEEKDNEALESPLPRPTGRNANAAGGADADVEKYAQPDAEVDRDAPGQPAEPDEGNPEIKEPPLEIKHIEDLEDDAKGG
jgi:hypothetical protein